MCRLVVGDNRQRIDVGTDGGERGREHKTVRLVDLTRRELVTGTCQLAACRQDRDAGATRARNLGHTGGRERSELHGPETHACFDDDVTRSHVTAARTNVRTRAHRLTSIDRVVMLDNILDWDDGVGALGNDTARRDRHRLTRRECTPCRPAGRDPLDDGQRAWEIGRAYRKAVHRRARERRQVNKRTRGLRRDASGGRRPHGHRLRRARMRVGEHERLRLRQCE